MASSPDVAALRARFGASLAGNPWIRFGAAVVVGYRLGRGESPGPPARHAHGLRAIVRSLMRAALVDVTAAVIRDVTRRVALR